MNQLQSLCKLDYIRCTRPVFTIHGEDQVLEFPFPIVGVKKEEGKDVRPYVDTTVLDLVVRSWYSTF